VIFKRYCPYLSNSRPNYLSTEKATYQLIAQILSKVYPVKPLRATLRSYQHWEALVAIGSAQLVLPALYRSLETKGLLDLIPADLKSYLKSLHDINYQRNLSIITQLQALARVLESEKIPYVLLKGTALLQYVATEDFGQRMIGDIDLLVPEAQLDRAQSHLLKAGYVEKHGFNYKPKGFRHLNRLVHTDYIAAVELHWSPLNAKYTAYLSAAEVLAARERKKGLWVPEPSILLAHSLLSLQLNDQGYFYRTLNYKSIYDGLLLALPEQQLSEDGRFQLKEIRTFFALAGCLFPDFKQLATDQALQQAQRSLNFRFDYPRLCSWLLWWKRLWRHAYGRITIFLTNASYRRHVLKNKIFPSFL